MSSYPRLPVSSEWEPGRVGQSLPRLLARFRSTDTVQFWSCLIGFGVLGFAARAAVALLRPVMHRPDEIFQTLEPAHRLLTGWGVVTWEWREGIRSWLFPQLLAGVMKLGPLLGLAPGESVALVWIALSLLASVVIGVAVILGWQHSRLSGAVLCGSLCAFWPTLVYLGPKTLLEVQSGNLLAIAAGLASMAPARGATASRRAASIGFLLGAAFALRFQLAPALLLVAAWTAWSDIRRGWVPLVAGALLPLALLGVSDSLAWGTPFQSVWKNLYVNLILSKSEQYGVEPIYWYATELAKINGAASLALAGFFALGARRAPLLAATSFTIIASHSLIAHKEISFIYPALAPALIVVGLGTAEFLARANLVLRVAASRNVMVGVAASCWLMIAGLTGAAQDLLHQSPELLGLANAWTELRRKPDLCGLGLYGRWFPWYATSGYSGLHRAIPLYLVHSEAELGAASAAFNYVVVDADRASDLRGYSIASCSKNVCVLRRDQACEPAADYEINRVLEREGR